MLLKFCLLTTSKGQWYQITTWQDNQVVWRLFSETEKMLQPQLSVLSYSWILQSCTVRQDDLQVCESLLTLSWEQLMCSLSQVVVAVPPPLCRLAGGDLWWERSGPGHWWGRSEVRAELWRECCRVTLTPGTTSMILMMITTGYSTFMMMMTMETVIWVASFISFISDVLGILDAHDEDWHGDL